MCNVWTGFFSFLIKHKFFIIIFFILICIPAVFGIKLVDTNFEISAFMPEDANSMQGSIIEQREFSSGSLGYLLLEDKENWRAEELKRQIEGMDGIEKVDWIGDVLDIYTPEDFLPEEALDQYKKDGSAIMIITFDDEADKSMVDNAIDTISSMIQQGEYFGGSPMVIKDLQNMLGHEQPLYLLIAGGILILLLAVSLSSYIAPLLCIVNIGIAILLNYGTNFIVTDRISFLTVAIAAIFQLAVSMDYSIFLIHRFEEDLLKTKGNTEAAMVSAMRATLVAISSSSLTDCAGFVALVFMHNQIGADLGVVLSKGVIISLIVSLTFLPCLIFATYGLGKKRHRTLIPSFEKAAGPMVKVRYFLLAAVVIILVPTSIGGLEQDYYYTTEEFMPDDTSPIIAANRISETFGTTDKVYVLYKKDMAAFEQQAMDAIDGIDNIRSVDGISNSAETLIPENFCPRS